MSIYASSIEQFEPRGRQLMTVHPPDDGTDEDNLASSILSNAPKLSSKSPSTGGGAIVKNEELWTIRAVSDSEEELYAKGKCVYWTKYSSIIKSFNFTDQVVKVFWSQFSKKDHVCIALTSGLSIFNTVGQHFQIPLPFVSHDMYSTRLGLIIERNCDPSDDSCLPTLFALTDPTQEISPILFKPQPRSNHQSKILTYSLPNVMSIVACHEELPICLIYNSQDSQHSIWRIRPTTGQEIDDFQRMNDESMTSPHLQSSCSFGALSQGGLNLSSRQKSGLMQNNPSTAGTLNFSPKMDLRSRHSALGNLAASRLGAGGAQMTPEANSTNLKSFESSHNINFMSTPNRNRIINYLRDNIEEPILPELTCEQIWTEASNGILKANKLFSTTDLIGNDYLVMVISASSQLRMMKYEQNRDSNLVTFGKASTITANDAMPIHAMNMMVVWDNRNTNLFLYSGLDCITKVIVPCFNPHSTRTLPTPSPASSKNPIDLMPIQSSSARKRSSMGDRASIISSDLSIQQMFQALSPVPHAKFDTRTSTPLSMGSIDKMEHVIGKSIYTLSSSNQRGKFVIPSLCQTYSIRKLLDAMKHIVPGELGLTIITKWYQTRRTCNQPEFMMACDEMRLFKNWFMSSIGAGENFFESDDNPSASNTRSTSSKPLFPSPTKKLKRMVESHPMLTKIHSLFYAIHLVFEDLLLVKQNYEIASDLAELLIVVACILKLDDYQEYYWLKFPHLQENFGPQKARLEKLIPKVWCTNRPTYFSSSPPSIMDFLSKIITKSKLKEVYTEDSELTPYPNVPGVTDNSFTVISLFSEMFNIKRDLSIKPVLTTLEPQTNQPYNILSEPPFRSKEADERVVTLMVELKKTRNYLASLPEAINLYLWDAILNCRESPPADWPESCYKLIGRIDLVNLVCGRIKVDRSCRAAKDSEDEALKLIFPDDIRVSEAHRMLASNVPVEFSVTQRQGATEEESRDETHRHLYLLNVRTMAMPVGRGAICLRTYSPVIGESFEVPRLELGGRAIAEDRPLEYTHDISVYPWPFFHNGVAAGLTICASTANNTIDSTWINYNRPRSSIAHGSEIRDRDLTAANTNNEHAGFLFALGLNGHLEKLSLMALHDYLCQNNDLTKLAILLGMSAAKRGSRDNNIIKVLSIHVDALLPPNSTELDVPAPVHTASIVGVGLLYQGSGDSHISKVLLEEIGRLPGPETNSHVDRESYSLSAGLAFGLVNLCKGGSSTISSSDQLRLYMLGGKRKSLTATQRERYFKQDCHRGEEDYINTHITSPGGTLGLGLMYHRTGNRSVANWMRAPDTQTLLEYVRPDFLILRMLSYGLIMWNEIQPTEEWINSHIPKIVSTHAFQRSSSSTSMGLVAPTISNQAIDFELISQAYCNIVAGCCMSIAMRYAGTADKDAYQTIYKHTKMLIVLNNKPILAEQAGRPCIETCLNVLVTSLAVVMAGTGDLGVMRVCRFLRSRLTQSCVFYGSYMALHMALGILFLGACRYSLSTSTESIGALVCALYPIYPNHSSDNRYHLQALRHLYVLAAEPRLLIPRDIQTNKPVYVKITVKQKEQETGKTIEMKLLAPCMMPEVEFVESVCVDDDRYWRIEINSREALIKCLSQDQGFLSVKQKAHSSNNQLVQDIETYIIHNMPQSTIKARKAATLAECVKEDRVEQYSALNKLVTYSEAQVEAIFGSQQQSKQQRGKFASLLLEQMRLVNTLADGHLRNKINLLQPVIGEIEDKLLTSEVQDKMCKYMMRDTSWINADTRVAYYITLNDLRGTTSNDDLIDSLRELNCWG